MHVELTCRLLKFRFCNALYVKPHSFPGQVQRLVRFWYNSLFWPAVNIKADLIASIHLAKLISVEGNYFYRPFIALIAECTCESLHWRPYQTAFTLFKCVRERDITFRDWENDSLSVWKFDTSAVEYDCAVTGIARIDKEHSRT
jgi:hypothetical protein